MKNFYTKVVNCPLSASECPLAVKDFSTGDIPRGFSYVDQVNPEILVVRKNPGHADKTEKAYYKGRTGKALFEAVMQYKKDRRGGKVRRSRNSNRFRLNELRYLLFVLGYHEQLRPFKSFKVRQNEERSLAKRAFFTNLFKCSTENEQAKIPSSAFSVCYQRYFLDELRRIRPKVILAAGNEVSHFLRRKAQDGQIDVPIVKVKHFSYFYTKNDEAVVLNRTRRLIQTAINRRPTHD